MKPRALPPQNSHLHVLGKHRKAKGDVLQTAILLKHLHVEMQASSGPCRGYSNPVYLEHRLQTQLVGFEKQSDTVEH